MIMLSVMDEVRNLEDGLRRAERLIQAMIDDIAAQPANILSSSTWDLFRHYDKYKVENPEVYGG